MLLGAVPAAEAHIASNGFLSLAVDRAAVAGALELAIRDGELAVGLDRDRDGKVSWGELRASQAALQDYVRGHLQLYGSRGRMPVELRSGAGQRARRWQLSMAAAHRRTAAAHSSA